MYVTRVRSIAAIRVPNIDWRENFDGGCEVAVASARASCFSSNDAVRSTVSRFDLCLDGIPGRFTDPRGTCPHSSPSGLMGACELVSFLKALLRRRRSRNKLPVSPGSDYPRRIVVEATSLSFPLSIAMLQDVVGESVSQGELTRTSLLSSLSSYGACRHVRTTLGAPWPKTSTRSSR